MIQTPIFNLNLLETMNFYWISIAARNKLTEKFINDIANDELFKLIYNKEFTSESVRRSLSALSNREPFSGNKVETIFYSRNLMILEYIDTLEEKMNAFKSLRLKEITQVLASKNIESNLEIIVLPSPFETVQQMDSKLILNFFKFHMLEGKLKADGMSIEELIINSIK